jgi:hypothetical protein
LGPLRQYMPGPKAAMWAVVEGRRMGRSERRVVGFMKDMVPLMYDVLVCLVVLGSG